MKPSRPGGGDRVATDDMLEEVSTALAAGRLVDLLRGHGLTKKTIDELLCPESAVALRSILTRHLVPLAGGHDRDPGPESCLVSSGGGKVLAFRGRELPRR